MDIVQRRIEKDGQILIGAYVKSTHVPNSSLLPESMPSTQRIDTWLNEDIDPNAKAILILKQGDLSKIKITMPSELVMALYLQKPHQDWINKLDNVYLADNIFPPDWNINTPTEIKNMVSIMGEEASFSYLAALNKNTFIVNRHNHNKTPVSKSTKTHTMIRTLDVLSWSTNFIKIVDDNDIRGIRKTIQLQKDEDNKFKVRISEKEEKVEELIYRELLPFRHRVNTDPVAIKELSDKMEKLNIPSTILLANEINKALEDNQFSKTLIEETLGLKWESINLQIIILKDSGMDNVDIIEEIKLASTLDIPENNGDYDLPPL